MATSAAIGGGGGGGSVKISTTPTWDAAYNFYDLTTVNTDVDFVVNSTTIIQNKSYLIRKADDGLGWILIKDESGNILQTIYKQYNYCSVMYDGTNFLIL